MRKFVIRAVLQNMSKDAVMEMIPGDTVTRIKQMDASPEFRVYAIAHEGEVSGKEVGFGQRVVQYFRDAIVQVSEKIKLGTKFFLGHNSDNSTAGREDVGEVVGKSLKVIDGKMYALAAAYIKPEHRTKTLDIASFEGVVGMNANDSRVLEIESVTGIALGNSKFAAPAFKGATLLATVQNYLSKGGDKMDKEEIKKAIAEGKFSITDFFSDDEIVNCDPARKARQTEYEHAKRVEKSLGEERAKVLDLTKEKTELTTKIGQLNETLNTTKASDLVKGSIATRKLSEQQTKFIDKHMSKFKSEKEGDELKLDVERFIDSQLKEYDDYTELITGKKPETKSENNEETNEEGASKTGHPSADGKSRDGVDLTDPKNNDFIPA